MDYYNTNELKDPEVKKRRQFGKTQRHKVLQFIRGAGRPVTCWDVFYSQFSKDYGLDNAPITSIRRAISDLQTQGKVQQAGTKVSGPYKISCKLWK